MEILQSHLERIAFLIFLVQAVAIVVTSQTSHQLRCSEVDDDIRSYKGRFFANYSISGPNPYFNISVPSVFACRHVCNERSCIALSYARENLQSGYNCHLYNSTNVQKHLIPTNHSSVILVLPARCGINSSVDGNWGTWESTSLCNMISCDSASYRKQTRKCENPAPDCNGNLCEDKSERVAACPDHQCTGSSVECLFHSQTKASVLISHNNPDHFVTVDSGSTNTVWLSEDIHTKPYEFDIVSGIVACGTSSHADEDCISFQSKQTPDTFMRHQSAWLKMDPRSSLTMRLLQDAAFIRIKNEFVEGYSSYKSVNYPTHFICSFPLQMKTVVPTAANQNQCTFLESEIGDPVSLYVYSRIQQHISMELIGDQGYMRVDNGTSLLSKFRIISPGFTGTQGTISLLSLDMPTPSYIRHQSGAILIARPSHVDEFFASATFFPRSSTFYPGFFAWEAESSLGNFIRYANGQFVLAKNDGGILFREESNFLVQKNCI